VEKVIKLKKWTSEVQNSNEKRIKKSLKELLPQYKHIHWTKELFQDFYIDLLNSLPARYKQKNSIEISGRLTKEIIEDAIHEKLEEISNEFSNSE
jgi:uncharacterized protein with von Willebrand factor type A (vWA) domain